MARVCVCKSLQGYIRNIYVSVNYRSSRYLKYNRVLHDTVFRGQGRNMYIPAAPTPNPLPLKVYLGKPVKVGSFGIKSRLAMSAPPVNSFHGITGNLKAKNKEEEANRGLDPYIVIQTANNTEKASHMKGHRRILKGDMINLNDLLFAENRDYLIRYNDDRQHIGRAYSSFVAAHSDIFSCMPWTAVPFSDRTSRERLRRIFCVGHSDLSSYVISSTGMVLQTDISHLYNEWGGLGYPFCDGTIEFLKSQDYAIVEQPSLKALLATPERDYVISNNGDKVLIDTLEEKVVALFFYEEGVTTNVLTSTLELAYEEFAKKRKEFEVVLIYLYDTKDTCRHTNEESFSKRFKSMPWLAIPFKDPSYRKLKRLFGYNVDDWFEETPSLVIVGPHSDFIELWADQVLLKYKLRAYPFTRKEAATIETEKVKELKLEMLWDCNTIFRRNDGTEVSFSQLAGKSIILFFEDKYIRQYAVDFLMLLALSYDDMSRDDLVEVICITSSKEGYLYEKSVPNMSWLFAHESQLLPIDLSVICCYCEPGDRYGIRGCECPPGWCGNEPILLVFDWDGKLVKKSRLFRFDLTYYFDSTNFFWEGENMCILSILG